MTDTRAKDPLRQGRLHDPTILSPYDVQSLRTRLVEGEMLTIAQTLELIGSHEHVRAYALAARSQVAVLKKANEDLVALVRRYERNAKGTT